MCGVHENLLTDLVSLICSPLNNVFFFSLNVQILYKYCALMIILD